MRAAHIRMNKEVFAYIIVLIQFHSPLRSQSDHRLAVAEQKDSTRQTRLVHTRWNTRYSSTKTLGDKISTKVSK